MNRIDDIVESCIAFSLIGAVFSLGFCSLVGVWILTGNATPNVVDGESVLAWWGCLYGSTWAGFMGAWLSIGLISFVCDAVKRR
jgi:hypothetical protein